MRVIDCEQGSPDWFAARRGIPTASEFGAIITKSGKPSASADAYMAELLDDLVRPLGERSQDEQMAAFAGNRHTERGHELEPKARQWYRLVTGLNPVQVGFVLREDSLAGCSPDSLVGDDGGLEIKAPEGKKHALWMIGGKLPDEHAQQVHGSLAITGRDWWDFLSYCPGYKPFLIRTHRNEYTEAVAKELDAFVARFAKVRAEFTDYIHAGD